MSEERKQKGVLAKPDLEEVIDRGCGTPGCTHENHGTLFVRARCHDERGVDASYTKGSGMLVLSCRICGNFVMAIRVADK